MSAPDQEDHIRHRHGSLISTRPLPLRRKGGTTRNPFRWLWLAWRYGWTHPDEDLLGVIDAAGDSLRAQIASARAVLSGDALKQAIEIEKELEHELCQDVPGLATLLALEARINALYPPAIQRRRAWMLRERFERVAPARAVVEYWASNPPEAGGPEVLAEEVRRCDALVEAATASLAAARADAKADPAVVNEAQARLDRAVAERGLAVARAEVDRSRRAMAAATEAARIAATGAQDVRDAAQSALDAARRAHGAAMDSLDAAEELLIRRGGALPAIPGSAIDADAQTLLGYIHSSYMMSIGREKAVRDLMRWLIMRFWSANVIAVLVLLLVFLVFKALPGTDFMPLGNLVVGLFFIAAVGRIGATMSVLQRLQAAVSANILSGDSFLELTRLRTGKNGINLALFSGAVFALLLYAIFATGAPAMLGFENGLFPQMATRTVATSTPGPEQGQNAVTSTGSKPAGTAGTSGTGGNAGSGAGTSATGGSGGNSVAEAPGNSAAGADGNVVAGGGGNNVDAGNMAADAGSGRRTEAENGMIADGNATGAAGPKPEEESRGFFGSLIYFFQHLFDSAPRQQCKANQPCDPFTQFAEALGFPTRMDFFKLLLWAFLAGFAERLVPDVLDSITRRTRNGLNAEEQATARRRRAAVDAATADNDAAAGTESGDQAGATPRASG